MARLASIARGTWEQRCLPDFFRAYSLLENGIGAAIRALRDAGRGFSNGFAASCAGLTRASIIECSAITGNFREFVELSFRRCEYVANPIDPDRGHPLRFFLLLVAAAATGALSLVAAQTFFPRSAPTYETVRALGNDLARLRLSDFNPIRAVYDDVAKKITSGNPAPPAFNLRPSVPVAVGPFQLPKPVQIDQREINRAIAAGVNARINQDYRRTQDLIQYGRNPMGWHGAPPH